MQRVAQMKSSELRKLYKSTLLSDEFYMQVERQHYADLIHEIVVLRFKIKKQGSGHNNASKDQI